MINMRTNTDKEIIEELINALDACISSMSGFEYQDDNVVIIPCPKLVM